eukprot:CAMPEP_0205833506 /NCGR_PEP_ID=MMETSP0206-20130828/49924_1 /ASSEMBLY_ACC=CAM_ASM_000279 /TAXON_ID=36767 /ORGANISM="Euplotes focardii, Strain TN1" /LENGTH=323 /DNA_ID=CAMNT_0053139981 /DNA_START=278 /DNA_END=1249 /DNA_ORIENTATION=+
MEVKVVLASWRALLLGIILILFVTSMLAAVMWRLPMRPRAFALGLALLATSPTTISSGILLTKQAGGLDSLAVILAASTNMLAIATVPVLFNELVLKHYHVDSGDVEFDVRRITLTLVYSVFAPLVVGKCLRFIRPVRDFLTKIQSFVKPFCTMLLGVLIIVEVSGSATQLATVGGLDLAVLLVTGLGFHLVLLAMNLCILALPGINGTVSRQLSVQKAVAIMCSQKTPAFPLTVANFLADELTGLVVIAVIITYLVQTMTDALIASQWSQGKWLCFRYKEERANDDSDLHPAEPTMHFGEGETFDAPLLPRSMSAMAAGEQA